MKKIALLLVTIISIGLATVSCSKKDSETSIEGKWIIIQEGKIVNGQELLNAHVNEATCEKDNTVFSSGGGAKDYDYRKLNGVCKEEITSYSYSRNGNELKINYSSGEVTGTILNLTDTELKVSAVSNGITSVAVFTKG